MQENTLQTLIDYIKETTGQTNASNAKVVRAINFAADEYSRIRIFGSGRWKRDSTNHGDISRVTATVSGSKSSLESELIALEYVHIYENGQYQAVLPVDQRDETEPLDSLYSGSGVPKYYDYDSHHIYWYPAISGSKTARLGYKRAHPRFSTDNLNQGLGTSPIDEEFLALGAMSRLTIGSNDPSHVSIRSMYDGMKRDIKNSIPMEDQNTPRRVKPKVNNVFKRQ